MSDAKIAFVRQTVPILVGFVFGALFFSLAGSAVTAAIAIGWYAFFRFFEERGSKRAGFFLGYPQPPLYQIDTDILASFTSDQGFDQEDKL